MTTDKIKARHLDDEFLQSLTQMDLLWENECESYKCVFCTDFNNSKYE